MLDQELYTRINENDNGEDNLLFLSCFNAIHVEQYRLPQFTPITDKIGQMFQPHLSEARTLHENAKLVQLDPAMAVNFLHLANIKYKSSSIPEAIAQMGEGSLYVYLHSINQSSGSINVTNNLIVQLSLALWEHSYLTGAFCALVASHLQGYDPDKAMLAGLLHDIGSIPVLTIGAENSELVENPLLLDAAMRQLKDPVGSLLCQRFRLPEYIASAMTHAENYQYISQEKVDYAELVTVAHIAMDQMEESELMTIPVCKKISSRLMNTKTLYGLLVEAKEDLWETYRILEG
ncbi:MAG TPA: HDOD domain-containing protein [Crenotrichaceae bacterium]|nr:HDOD domain-containing protein [Crenotrichaceae bacterium]